MWSHYNHSNYEATGYHELVCSSSLMKKNSPMQVNTHRFNGDEIIGQPIWWSKDDFSQKIERI